ncbi:MAG TPA: hypothetical protein VNN74_07285 [Candidatus Micrarchaeia archaeon]|nr:hypothetical protein [Candidatus Micrarchaeia archaeon]
MTSTGRKLMIVAGGLAVVVVAAALYITQWLSYIQPEQAPAVTVSSSGQKQANLELATLGSIGFTSHATWVAYLVRQGGRWVHSTNWVLPAHALVHVTILQYDTQTGLRNPFLSQVRGTVGSVEYVDGHAVHYMDPTLPAHTFSIPELGVNVPLYGIPNATYPGTFGNPHNTHETITFSFRTGGKGLLHWQCFVPCAAGFLFGNGGPMQTVGYMDGYIHVV